MSKSVILGSLAVLLSIGSAQAADSGIRSILGRWCAGTSWPVPKKGSGDFARLVYMFQNQGHGKLRLNGHWAFKSHRRATPPEPGMYSSMSKGTYAGNPISVIGSITKSDH